MKDAVIIANTDGLIVKKSSKQRLVIGLNLIQ